MTPKNRNQFAAACLVMLVLIAGGYILFRQQREIQSLKLAVATAGTGYASLAAEWTPVVPQVDCADSGDSSEGYGGSGILLKRSNGKFYILTSAHIVLYDSNTVAPYCDVIFPDAASTTYTVDKAQITTDPDGTDAALLQLPQDNYLSALVSTNGRKICTTPPSIGDITFDLGYPDIGSSDGITASQGIIAGDEGDYYVNSALTDDGSSGGAAIDVNNDCYFGIPSFVTGDDGASLGRTLKWSELFTDDPANLSGARL